MMIHNVIHTTGSDTGPFNLSPYKAQKMASFTMSLKNQISPPRLATWVFCCSGVKLFMTFSGAFQQRDWSSLSFSSTAHFTDKETVANRVK